MKEKDKDRTYKGIILIAVVLGLTSLSIATQPNLIFSFNLSGQPQIFNYTILECLDNITCTQDTTNHKISLSLNETAINDTFVPYVGANKNVNLGNFGINASNGSFNDISSNGLTNPNFGNVVNVSNSLWLNNSAFDIVSKNGLCFQHFNDNGISPDVTILCTDAALSHSVGVDINPINGVSLNHDALTFSLNGGYKFVNLPNAPNKLQSTCYDPLSSIFYTNIFTTCDDKNISAIIDEINRTKTNHSDFIGGFGINVTTDNFNVTISSTINALGTSFFFHNVSTNNTDKLNSSYTPYLSKEMNTTIDSPNIEYFNISSLPNGNTMLINFTTEPLNITFIPAGVHEVHVHGLKFSGINKVVKLFYDCAVVNSTGENFSLRGTSDLSQEITSAPPYTEVNIDMTMMDEHLNLTDRLVVRLWATVTGSGTAPDLSIGFDDLTDARLQLPSSILDQATIRHMFSAGQNLTYDSNIGVFDDIRPPKVNKSGDTMTGNLTLVNSSGMPRIGLEYVDPSTKDYASLKLYGYFNGFSGVATATGGDQTRVFTQHTANVYRDGGTSWEKINTSKGGIVVNYEGNSINNGIRDVPYAVSIFGTAPSSNPVSNFEALMILDNKSVIIPKVASETTTKDWLCFDTGTGEVFHNPGTCTISDMGLKENISVVNITSGIKDRFQKIQVIKYQEINDPNHIFRYGINSTKLLQDFPLLVNVNDVGVPVSINYELLSVVDALIIQDQNNRITTLETIVTKICSNNQTLCR